MRFTILFLVPPQQALEVLNRFRSMLKDNQPHIVPAGSGMRIEHWDYEHVPLEDTWGLRAWVKRQYRMDVLRLVKLAFLNGELPNCDIAPYRMRKVQDDYVIQTVWWRIETKCKMAKADPAPNARPPLMPMIQTVQ